MEETQRIFCVGTHRYSLRPGTPAEVIGVAMVKPEGGHAPRPCFKLRFADGREDFVPIFAAPGSTEKNTHYELVTEGDVRAGRIPAVTH